MLRFTSFILILLIVEGKLFAQIGNGQKSIRMHSDRAIKINLLSPFYGTLNIAFAKGLKNSNVFQVTGSYTDFNGGGETNIPRSQIPKRTTTVDGNTTTNVYISRTLRQQRLLGGSLCAEYRINLNGKKLSGSYFAPFARYMYYNYQQMYDDIISTQVVVLNTIVSQTQRFETSSANFVHQVMGFGLIFGSQKVYKNKVVIDAFIGPSFSLLVNTNYNPQTNRDLAWPNTIPNVYLQGYGVRAGVAIGILY
jgi:hypothetical protein